MNKYFKGSELKIELLFGFGGGALLLHELDITSLMTEEHSLITCCFMEKKNIPSILCMSGEDQNIA